MSKNVYIDKLNDKLNKYNNKYHNPIKKCFLKKLGKYAIYIDTEAIPRHFFVVLVHHF